jgi:hypothetical protein
MQEEFSHFVQMQEIAKHSLPTRTQLESKARHINRINSLIQVSKDTRTSPSHSRVQLQSVVKQEPSRTFLFPAPDAQHSQLPTPPATTTPRYNDTGANTPHPPPIRFAAAIPTSSMEYSKLSGESSSLKPASPVIRPLTPPTSVKSSSQLTDPGKSLDVSDALSYLDLVKMQFESLPATYNQWVFTYTHALSV